MAVSILKHCERKLCNMRHLEDILTYLKADVPSECDVMGPSARLGLGVALADHQAEECCGPEQASMADNGQCVRVISPDRNRQQIIACTIATSVLAAW